MRLVPSSLGSLALLAAAALAAAPAPAAGQITVGARLGWNLSDLRDLDDIDVNRESATAGGIYLNVGDAVSFQPELLFSKREVSLIDVGGGADLSVPFRQNFIEVPLLVVFRPVDAPIQPSVYGGASVSFETDCETSYGDVPDCDGFFGAETDSRLWAGVVGAGLHLDLGPLVLGVDARYNHGLTELAPATEAKWSYWTVGIEAGIGVGR